MSATLAAVTVPDLEHYRQQGYVLLRGVLPPSLLESVQNLFAQWVDVRAEEWKAAGLIEDLRADLPFDKRFNVLWLEAGQPDYHRSPRAELVRLDARRTFDLLRHPALLDAAAALMKTDHLVSHGVWNMRPKCPGARHTDTPLHQDAQYFPDQARTGVMSAWFPLHAVDENRSCLEVSPGYDSGHLFDPDESSGTGFIGIRRKDSKDLPRQPIAMEPGDLLCFTDLTPHGATPNLTQVMRWSMDMRFAPAATALPAALERGFVARSPEPGDLTSFEDWHAKWPADEAW